MCWEGQAPAGTLRLGRSVESVGSGTDSMGMFGDPSSVGPSSVGCALPGVLPVVKVLVRSDWLMTKIRLGTSTY